MKTPEIDPIATAVPLIRALFVAAYRSHEQLKTGVIPDWGNGHMNEWDGGYNGTQNRPCQWTKIATICAENQFDPASFISAQFRALGEKKMVASFFSGKDAIRRYKVDIDNAIPRLKFALKAQRSLLSVESTIRAHGRKLSPRDAVESVLGDMTLDMSGLFRYGVAAKYEFASVAERFIGPAMIQYMFRRKAYDEAWGDLPIPDGFRSTVEASFTPTARVYV